MKSLFSRFLPIMGLLVCLGLNGCFTEMVSEKFPPIQEASLKEIRQTPAGDLALVYSDQPPFGKHRDAATEHLHVFAPDMGQLGALVEQSRGQPATPTNTNSAEVWTDISARGETTRLNAQKIPGQWLPKFDEPGISPAEAAIKLAPWFNPEVTATALGRTQVQWNGPAGPRQLSFYNAVWSRNNPAMYVLMVPTGVLDVATSPVQMTWFLLFFHDE